MVVLQVLDRENLDLQRLTRGGNESLRKAIKYAVTQWLKIGDLDSGLSSAGNRLNGGSSATSSACGDHSSSSRLHQGIGGIGGNPSALSQQRMDNLFSKKSVVEGLADGLVVDTVENMKKKDRANQVREMV
jgi:hypothetical protein